MVNLQILSKLWVRQIKRIRGFRQFLLRGLELIAAEWQLICLTHNLLKIWRFTTPRH